MTTVLFGCILAILALQSFNTAKKEKEGTLRIRFVHTVKGQPLTLRDSSYTNPLGEIYSINKLKYYLGHFSANGKTNGMTTEPYFLVNAANETQTIDIKLAPGNYQSLGFVLGVDSADNCSGAQTGALDPLNDMFWTWNSGYIFFKLEGSSLNSSSDLNRIEHHIGGYKGNNNVAKSILLNTPKDQPILIKENNITEIVIENDMDRYWNSVSRLSITEMPVCMSPGELSKKIAANFSSLFSIQSIHQPIEN